MIPSMQYCMKGKMVERLKDKLASSQKESEMNSQRKESW